MKSFRDPNYVERYKDVIFDLETALNTTVANNAHQKKDGYRFVVDNSGEVTPFDWYNARISLDFKVVLLANGGNIAVADHIEKHSLLYSSQYGFRQAHSTQHAILDMVESIQTNMDKKTLFMWCFY